VPGGKLNRIVGRLAACAVVAGLMVVGARPAVAAEQAAPTAAPAASTGPAGVHAPSASLIEAATGKILWSRASATERPMGSITKVMTAYVVIEAGDLNQVITVPSGIVAYDEGGASTAGLVPGEKLTALQLLYAMLLPSGCDAAYTLATAYGPGRAAFIGKMNATAKKLGLTRTHFSDFSGLPYPTPYSNYSTAANLAGLGRAAMKLPLLRQIVATRTYKVAAGGGHYAHVWTNLNPLLGKYPGATGIKTGFTPAAGDCLLFSAVRGKNDLIGVVLDSSPSINGMNVAAADAKAILNWGFSR